MLNVHVNVVMLHCSANDSPARYNGKWLPDFIERLKASAWHQLYLPLLPFTHARSESIIHRSIIHRPIIHTSTDFYIVIKSKVLVHIIFDGVLFSKFTVYKISSTFFFVTLADILN